MITARVLDPDLRDIYYGLAGRYGDVFSTRGWHDLFGNELQLVGLFDDEGELQGGFHLMRSHAGPFAYTRNPLFTPHIGFFFHNPAQHEVKRRSRLKTAMTAVARYLRETRCPVISCALDPSLTDMQPFFWNGFKVIPNYTYRLHLNIPEDALLEGISGDRRNDMRKATRDGIRVEQPESLEVIRRLVDMTFSRQSKKYSRELVKRILFGFATPDNSFAFTACHEGRPVAGVFCVHSGNKVYYLLGGYDHHEGHSGAGVLALWEAILHARATGARIFDFEGSMVPAIEKYFRGFGGELVPYFTVNRAWLPLEFALKLVKRSVF
ncbi:MAG: GNAT family N-acetyltransferase [Bacteroidales bacterium]|nr:GNAT family N-acetyltransferase [Bacteroidales bacterium]